MKKKKSLYLWIFTFVFTLAIAYYQRVTGPTYPLKGTVNIGGKEVRFKLPRTSDEQSGQEVKIEVSDQNVAGNLTYRRYKSFDTSTTKALERKGDCLVGVIPPQPPAGKVMYNISLYNNSETVEVSEEPIIIRYKGLVPSGILISHILIMFLAMLFSTRTGLEAIFNGFSTYRYSFVTLVTLFIGGAILGPIMQKYAFGAYWTGWPFGNDLTDNKTLVALIFWGIAFFKLARNKYNTKWAIIAALILLAVYLVPHSLLGSELDYTKA